MTLKVKISNLFFGFGEWLKEKITGERVEYAINPGLVYLETVGEENDRP